jgi:aldose 1-epimerase
VLGTVLHPRRGYPFTLDPFTLDVSIDYSVLDSPRGDRRTGLTVATTATHLGDTSCPYATGHHPYLRGATGSS